MDIIVPNQNKFGPVVHIYIVHCVNIYIFF